jgi:hypothetical protein
MTNTCKPLFSLGQIVSTPGAVSALGKEGIDASSLLQRHITGDWAEMSEDDKRENDLSAAEGFRILSAYTLPRTQREALGHHRSRPFRDHFALAG